MQVARLAYFKSSGIYNFRGISRGSGGMVRATLQEQILLKNKENPVMVYSKSYCPFCGQVKSLFSNLEIEFKTVELDEIADGAEVQDALSEVSGMTTVPQVFIKEKLIGGCDDVMAAHRSGKLKEYLGDIKSKL
eukprot:TRINITY_DN2023_c0_g1_i1.p3 TRINITY_DN2023_c0_g1~~TRINITY_DN2023_c0_g1_i1.p3  ORF type:complete len:134 (-),score=16.06 TRINITY_DN2023_c0_g1_i1:300-701(-)